MWLGVWCESVDQQFPAAPSSSLFPSTSSSDLSSVSAPKGSDVGWGGNKAFECEAHIWLFGCWTISLFWKFTQLSALLNTPSSDEKYLRRCSLGKAYVLPPSCTDTLTTNMGGYETSQIKGRSYCLAQWDIKSNGVRGWTNFLFPAPWQHMDYLLTSVSPLGPGNASHWHLLTTFAELVMYMYPFNFFNRKFNGIQFSREMGFQEQLCSSSTLWASACAEADSWVCTSALVFTREAVSHEQTYILPRLFPVYFLKIHFMLTAEFRGTTPPNIYTCLVIGVILVSRNLQKDLWLAAYAVLPFTPLCSLL